LKNKPIDDERDEATWLSDNHYHFTNYATGDKACKVEPGINRQYNMTALAREQTNIGVASVESAALATLNIVLTASWRRVL